MRRRLLLLLLLLAMRWCVILSDSCQNDRNQDHRPRVSCVSQRLTALPDGIPNDTQVLVLSGNHFSSLSWSLFSGFTELHELDLSHNHITALEPPGPVLEKLSVLRLSGNRLAGLGGLVFHCAPSLMEIHLDRNHIRSLHDRTFSDLPLLEVINLSQNRLPALPPRLLEQVSSSVLKTFDLENNSVSLMPDGFFSSKPELPYVYLTYNPWLCSCAIGYLHAYLNNEEHNVYKHDGPNNIVPAAETVVCSGPAHLVDQPIIELEENDFCSPDPTYPLPLHPSGYLDSDDHPTLPSISVKPISNTQIPNAPHDTTIASRLPAHTISWTPAGKSWVTESWAELRSEFWTETVMPGSASAPAGVTTELTDSRRLITSNAPSEPPITGSAGYQGQGPTQADNRLPMIRTHLPTIEVITDRYQHQTTTKANPLTKANLLASTGEMPTTGLISAQTEHPTSEGSYRADARDEEGRVLSWCWWLFAGFVLLCVLSALTSCVLFLWLLRNLMVYRRLQRQASARPYSDGVTLRAYRCTENTQGREKEGKSVSFLALEQIKDVQAVFRSVLFIDQKDERHGRSQTKDDASQVELVSMADKAQDQEQAPMVSGEVFRKTLYRVISREEEADGWTEEEKHWEQTREGTTARYSLILREERGQQRETQWVVGEWELGGGGVACERSGSLIGQSSSAAL